MRADELYDLTQWIQSQIVRTRIVKKYQVLHNILSQNTTNATKQPFANEQAALVAALRSIDLAKLTDAQLAVLSKIGIAPHVGGPGAEALEDVLYRNAVDVATAASRVHQSIEAINAGIEWTQSMTTLLDKIVDVKPVHEPEGAVVIRIHFTAGAHMSNIAEFKEWGETWYMIARGITMAHDQAPENLRIIGAGDGSIVLDVAAVYAVARTASSIIKWGLEIAEKVMQIRMQAEQVRSLQIANDSAKTAYNSLKDAATKVRDDGTKEIVQKVIKEIGLKKDGDAEKVNALTRSVEKLTEFIEKGGEVEFILRKDTADVEPNEGDADPERAERVELWKKFEEIRKLEHRIRQIEHHQEPEPGQS